MHGHASLDSGEQVQHACYGLGRQIVALANRSVSPVTKTWNAPEESATGLAAPIDRSGVVVLTDRRLLFFRKRFSIGTPKHLTHAWSLDQIRRVEFQEENLVIDFADGSQAGLHVPPMQKPKRLVELFVELSNTREK